MGRQKIYDYIIIGSGNAGQYAASHFKKPNNSVAIIEANKWGGAHINSHDLVYETALELSHLYYTAKQGAKLGLSSGNLRYNYPSVLNYRQNLVHKTSINLKKYFENTGIDCIHGFANFISKKVLCVNGEHLLAKKYIVATGSIFEHPQISGLELVSCYTSDNAFLLNYVPKQIAVIGGGQHGCMIAQYYAELGSSVTLLEQKEETFSNRVLKNSEDLPIKIINNARVIALEPCKKNAKKIIWNSESHTKSCTVDEVILATGYQPATDLGLENADVEYSKFGIKTDKYNRTSNKHVLAFGSVCE